MDKDGLSAILEHALQRNLNGADTLLIHKYLIVCTIIGSVVMFLIRWPVNLQRDRNEWSVAGRQRKISEGDLSWLSRIDG